MKVPSFHVKLVENVKGKTLADLPEWTLAECSYDKMTSLMRFRVRDFAYSADRTSGRSPMKQDPAKKYAVKRVIGKIICK